MRVAIAGFGIGGAALSIALARDGHDVTVYIGRRAHVVREGNTSAGGHR
jgi:2-polyprenyl-6-methoxyphenol hydroxylase-like FAD-dependent oxidoreductase